MLHQDAVSDGEIALNILHALTTTLCRHGTLHPMDLENAIAKLNYTASINQHTQQGLSSRLAAEHLITWLLETTNAG